MVSAFSPHYSVLQSLPPTVTGAILEVHQKTGAPIEIVIVVALSALSVPLNGFVLRTPSGREMSTQLYCMGIGPPTCGKGAVVDEFYRAIREFDCSLSTRRTNYGEMGLTPSVHDLILNDVTWPSLMEILDGDENNVVVLDEDCIDLLSSDFIKRLGKLNRFFDTPAKESLVRRGDVRLAAYRPSLAICGLTQPEIYADHLRSTRFTARRAGFAARCIFGYAQGERSAAYSRLPTPNLDLLREKQTRFLEWGLWRRLSSLGRGVLELDDAAIGRWDEISCEIRERKHFDFKGIEDAADRATEHTWRTAVMLHAYSAIDLTEPATPMPPVSREAIEAGWMLTQLSLASFRQVFPPALPKMPRPSAVQLRQQEEARSAMQHLYAHMARTSTSSIELRTAQSLSYLSPYKFRTVLAHMQSRKWVEVDDEGALCFTSPFFAFMTGHSSNWHDAQVPSNVYISLPAGKSPI